MPPSAIGDGRGRLPPLSGNHSQTHCPPTWCALMLSICLQRCQNSGVFRPERKGEDEATRVACCETFHSSKTRGRLACGTVLRQTEDQPSRLRFSASANRSPMLLLRRSVGCTRRWRQFRKECGMAPMAPAIDCFQVEHAGVWIWCGEAASTSRRGRHSRNFASDRCNRRATFSGGTSPGSTRNRTSAARGTILGHAQLRPHALQRYLLAARSPGN